MTTQGRGGESFESRVYKGKNKANFEKTILEIMKGLQVHCDTGILNNSRGRRGKGVSLLPLPPPYCQNYNLPLERRMPGAGIAFAVLRVPQRKAGGTSSS